MDKRLSCSHDRTIEIPFGYNGKLMEYICVNCGSSQTLYAEGRITDWVRNTNLNPLQCLK